MGSTTEEASLPNNEAVAQRQKEIATLNADTMNVPKRIQNSFHVITFILGALQLFLAYFIYTIIYSQEQSTFTKINSKTQKLETFSIEHSSQNIFFIAVIYFVICLLSYFTNDLQTYFGNIKNVKELNNCYNNIRNSVVLMTFEIQCYHYEQKTKKGSKTKVVTHKATKNIKFSECYDLSGFLKPQVEKEFKRDFAFVKYIANYEFLEKQEEKILDAMYQQFVRTNKRDSQQEHKKSFKFTDCNVQTQQAYTMKREESWLNVLLFIINFLCLGWPVSLLIEFLQVERYEVKIIKKIKLDESQQGYKKIAQ